MGLLKTYTTALEDAEVGEISVILNSKAEKAGSHATCDYIGFAIGNLEAGIERIDSQIKLMQEIKARAKEQIEVIKIGASNWLSDNGVDRIEGDVVSSVTIFEKVPTQKVIIEDEKLIDVSYCKLVADTTLIKQAINEGVEVKGARLEVTHNEPSIRLNKKKVKIVDELGF
jgi:hypothetical protein